jgi:RHS repeat-associated protein
VAPVPAAFSIHHEGAPGPSLLGTWDARTTKGPTPMTTAATCAFGEVSHSQSNYRGEQYDSDLGLYYMRARYYNPLTGRFLSRDPEHGIPTDPASLHKYLYAFGDPVNRIDPRGRAAAEYGLTFALLDTAPLPALTELAGGAYATAASYAIQGYLAAMAAATTLAAKATDFVEAVEWAKVVAGISKAFICDGLGAALTSLIDEALGEHASDFIPDELTGKYYEACGELLGKWSGFE